MGFIERLKEQALVDALKEQQIKLQSKTAERERLQTKAAETEHRAQRKRQAENFRQESGVGAVVAELGEFFKEFGRGSSSSDLGNIVHYTPVDHDSVFDSVEWDKEEKHHYSASAGWWFENSHLHSTFFSEKYIVVETCPDGKIIFGRGRTTIQVKEWRGKNKRGIFDTALENEYNNPKINKYKVVWKDGIQVSIEPVYYVG